MEKAQDLAAVGFAFVGSDGKCKAVRVQLFQSFTDTGIKTGFVCDMFVVVAEENLQTTFLFIGGDIGECPFHKTPGTFPHQLLHVGNGKNREAEYLAHMVGGISQIVQ
jgi:hypothetical protein